MENDEFVKFVLEHGDVRPLEEAFKENPVEEEEHKGKLSAYVAEEKGIYKYVAKYEVGDIVFVKEYKYQDGRNGSNHLFVIIVKIGTVEAMQIEEYKKCYKANRMRMKK